MSHFNKKSFLFLALFTILGFLALQIPASTLAGSGAKFTLFDAFAPIAGGFLGSIPGAISVLVMQLLNLAWHGFHITDAGTIIRLFPIVFAAIYFGRKTPVNVIIPLLAMAVFIANPVGRSVWYFSLFWLIPVAAYFYQEKSLIVRALGATFAAHAVGGAIWIWVFHLPKAVWVGLIPIVAMERLMFAAGIIISYLVVNNVLNWMNSKNFVNYKFPVNERYVWSS
jgi:hypothetical protein